MSDPIKILDGAVTLYQRTSNGARTWTARYLPRKHLVSDSHRKEEG